MEILEGQKVYKKSNYKCVLGGGHAREDTETKETTALTTLGNIVLFNEKKFDRIATINHGI